MTDDPSVPSPQCWVEVDRKVRVRVSAKDLLTFLTTSAHITKLDKMGLAEVAYDEATGMIVITCSTVSHTDPEDAIVDFGS